MTIEPATAKKTPWLFIALGAIGVLCLCVIVIGVAILAFFMPTRVSTTATEAPPVATIETEPAQPTIPADETQESTNPVLPESAPAGSPVEIGNDMTLTILNVTRPADDIVANGSVLNTTAPEGEEFIQVDVQVTCNSEPGTQCSFYPTVMKAVISGGSTRDLQTFIEGVDDWDTTIKIEGGATEQGFLLFIVPNSETDIIVSYQDIYADGPLYFQLP